MRHYGRSVNTLGYRPIGQAVGHMSAGDEIVIAALRAGLSDGLLPSPP